MNNPCILPPHPIGLIGYSETRTNLPGGRAANIFTMRACVVRADGKERWELAAEWCDRPNSWTQFSGWSPDGRQAIITRGWESSENAAWEEEHRQFRFIPEGWLLDCCLVDIATGQVMNVTAVERVSCYNSGLFFWPNDPTRLGFQAIIDGESKPFSMQPDGTGKQNLSRQPGFAYGFSASPDGARISYHQDYQVYLADADGAGAARIATGHPFNFCPTWSPDGQWVTFLSGEHYHCHPYLVSRDGSGLRKLADRGDYTGVMVFLDVPDFHGGSSDTPCWSPDSRWVYCTAGMGENVELMRVSRAGAMEQVYYTAGMGENVELMRVSRAGAMEQLTRSASGVRHYHPRVSPDGQWVVFGLLRDGVRQAYVARANGTDPRALTCLPPGHAALWPCWQPWRADYLR